MLTYCLRAAAAAAGALLLAASASAAEKLVIAASEVPHAQILEFVKPTLAREGVTLDIKVFSDYVQPNLQTADKQVDVNFFQHKLIWILSTRTGAPSWSRWPRCTWSLSGHIPARSSAWTN